MQMPHFTVQKGYDSSPAIELKEGEFLVGREDDCDFVIHKGDVSRHHAKVVMQGKKVHIEDLGSSNGHLRELDPHQGAGGAQAPGHRADRGERPGLQQRGDVHRDGARGHHPGRADEDHRAVHVLFHDPRDQEARGEHWQGVQGQAGGGAGHHPVPAGRRAHPHRGRPGGGQEHPGAGAVEVHPGDLQAHPVHAGHAAVGHHRGERLRRQQEGVRVHARADLRQHHPGRRDQPHHAADAVEPAGVHVGVGDQHRRAHPRAAQAVLRGRHPEPVGLPRDLPAAGAAARPLPDEDLHRLPGREDREGDPDLADDAAPHQRHLLRGEGGGDPAVPGAGARHPHLGADQGLHREDRERHPPPPGAGDQLQPAGVARPDAPEPMPGRLPGAAVRHPQGRARPGQAGAAAPHDLEAARPKQVGRRRRAGPTTSSRTSRWKTRKSARCSWFCQPSGAW